MSYNHGREFKKFQARQRRLRRQYEQAGMPESDIDALYQADLQEFNNDRRHEEHNPIRLDDCKPLLAPEDGGHSRLWWVEEIGNPALAGRLKSLSEADLELLTLYVFDGFGQVRPEYAGKLNFYLSVVDDMLRHESDNPSIGILLCKERDKLTAEYALRDINKPIGVSEYRLSDFVPQELADTLPSAEDIEKRIMNKYEIQEDEAETGGAGV